MSKDENASLRVLLIGVALMAATVVCVAFLIAVGILRMSGGHAIGAGVALLLVALLAAAISALGPKYRPTPFLTPLTAGVFTLLFATTMVYAAHNQVSTRSEASVATKVPVVAAAPMKRPVKTQPVVGKAEIPPDKIPEERSVRLLDHAFDDKFDDRVPEKPAMPAMPAPAVKAKPVEKATASIETEVPRAPQAPAAMPAPAAAAAEDGAPVKTAKHSVPLPAIAPGDRTIATVRPVFDPSGPGNKPPAAADAEGKTATAAATPPRPRIRPCGADGPACR